VRSLKNYSDPILRSQSMGQGFFFKQGFVSSLLFFFFCPPSPTLASSPRQRENRTGLRVEGLKQLKLLLECGPRVHRKERAQVPSLSCYSSLLFLPYSSTEINQEKHLIAASLFA